MAVLPTDPLYMSPDELDSYPAPSGPGPGPNPGATFLESQHLFNPMLTDLPGRLPAQGSDISPQEYIRMIFQQLQGR